MSSASPQQQAGSSAPSFARSVLDKIEELRQWDDELRDDTGELADIGFHARANRSAGGIDVETVEARIRAVIERVRRCAARYQDLSVAAVELGCDDTVAAALEGKSALIWDIADGRARLSSPDTFTAAREQANQVFQSEAIAGIPLHRAGNVALNKLALAARKLIAGEPVPAAAQQAAPNLAQTADALFPAEHYQLKWGIPAKRLDKARRDGRLSGQKPHGRWLYKLSDVQQLWPADFHGDDSR